MNRGVQHLKGCLAEICRQGVLRRSPETEGPDVVTLGQRFPAEPLDRVAGESPVDEAQRRCDPVLLEIRPSCGCRGSGQNSCVSVIAPSPIGPS